MKLKFTSILCFITFGCILLIQSCSKNSDSSSGTSNVKDTWAIIQDNILTPSCATSGCHLSASDATFIQHNLILTSAVAYENLFNVASKNSAAVSAGILRVKPGNYLQSLLYLKTDCQAPSITKYGASMPLGSAFLSQGKIEFIKQWITNGAPKKGAVVDEAVLANNNLCIQTFVPLTAPLPTEGFQLKIDPFIVNTNTEREVFMSRITPNTSTIYVNKFTMQGRANSHHFVLYGFQNTSLQPPANSFRDLYNPDGSINATTFTQMQNHIFLGGGTDVNQTYTFPTGIALKVPASTSWDLNAHYFNKQVGGLTGENYLNVYTVPQSAVVKEAQSINFSNYNFSIAASTRTTITTNYTFTQSATVFMLTSHFHKMGEKFQIKIFGGTRNGELVYENLDWEHPKVINFPTPIVLKAGEGLTSVVTYNNTSNKVISFGLTSENEMNIIFGYYY